MPAGNEASVSNGWHGQETTANLSQQEYLQRIKSITLDHQILSVTARLIPPHEFVVVGIESGLAYVLSVNGKRYSF